MNRYAKKYIKRVRNQRAPGTGCHHSLLGAANYGIMALMSVANDDAKRKDHLKNSLLDDVREKVRFTATTGGADHEN